jgi:hypothetical protein
MIALGLAGVAAAQQGTNSLTPKEKADGWKLLFNGKNLEGWEARPTSQPGKNGDWLVKDGDLVCPGTSAGWIGTDQMYKDYELKLQFRGDAKVNSGVFLRSQKEGQPHITGYELQIWDYQPAGYLTGSLVGKAKATAEGKVVGDQWNDYDITADGDHYTVVLNGKTILETHEGSHTGAGAIGLQCQPQNHVEFRNLKVRALR